MEKSNPGQDSRELTALLEEYRALYSLATLRINALDRRVPVTLATVAATLGAMDAVSRESQLILLLGLPLSLVWIVRATVNHARSFEDTLRRIEQIERDVNELIRKPVMRFQSRHPSRLNQVGGRTSRETVSAVLATSSVVLAVAAFRMHMAMLLPSNLELGYAALLGLVGIEIISEGVRLRRYQYEQPADIELSIERKR